MAEPRGNPNPASRLPITRGNGSMLMTEEGRELMSSFTPFTAATPFGAQATVEAADTGNKAAELLGTSASRDVQGSLAVRNETDLNDTIAPDFMEGMKDRRPPAVIARELKERSFPKTSIKFLQEQIENIVAEGRGTINPAVAAKILERSQGQMAASGTMTQIGEQVGKAINRLSFGKLGNSESDLGDGVTVEKSKVNSFVDEIKSGRVMDGVAVYQQRQAAAGQLQAADTAYNNALRQAQEADAMARQGDQRIARIMPDLLRKVERTRAERAMVAAQVGGNETQRFDGAPLRPDGTR